MKQNTWDNTTAEFNGEDWCFKHVPLDACPEWHGSTCFSERDLGCSSTRTPEQAIAALKYWLTKP
jgi:hypothetical protein